MKPINIRELLKAVDGSTNELRRLPNRIERISLDSRTLQPNDLFWAIKGNNYDGHDFVESAQQAGASACIVNANSKQNQQADPERLIFVKDALTALQDYAKWYRSTCPASVIALTGSYGKTTTRELLFSVLATKFDCLQNQGNQNNEIGVPLTILQLNDQHEHLIVELGAANPGDIKPLAKITSPQFGLITGIGPAHMEGFHTQEQIIKTKGDLIASLPADGLALIPGGEIWSEQLINRADCQVITFGLSPENHYNATHVESSNHQVTFQCNGHKYHLPLIGRHHVTTGLSAVAVGTELGLTPVEIQQGFQEFQPRPGRGQVVQNRPWTIIDDTYNASPATCEAACRTLANWQTNGRRFFVIGDMLDLGPDTDRYHRQLGRLASELKIDFVYAYGDYSDQIKMGAASSRRFGTEVFPYADRNQLSKELKDRLRDDDVVLVKGSRGRQMEVVVNDLLSEATDNIEVLSVH